MRTSTARTLRALGYRVITAADATEAREAVQAVESLPFDALVSDVVMPGVNGPQLASMLLAEKSIRRVLLMSGYAFEQRDSELPPGARFLPKPFTTQELALRLRELLS